MKVKEGVSLEGLQPEMRIVMDLANRIWLNHGQECVITAGCKFVADDCFIDDDGLMELIHSARSLHPFGYALDLRHRYFSDAEKEIVAEELRKELGPDYDVVVEATHIHAEYDSKFKESFWSFLGG